MTATATAVSSSVTMTSTMVKPRSERDLRVELEPATTLHGRRRCRSPGR
jgi:hypothetical protein